MGIMDQIANPQMADIAGALDYRQKRLDADEQKRKRIRIGQLVSEAVPNLREGSPLYQLASESPEQFAVFAKATGVPLNSGEQMQQFADDTALLYHTAQTDPYAAIETAQALKRERNEAGRDTPQLDKWLQAVEEDPQTAFTGLFTTHRSINQDSEPEKPAGLREFEGMTEGLSEEDREKARRIELGLDPRAGISADERIAQNPELAQRITDLEAKLTRATESAKQDVRSQSPEEIRKQAAEVQKTKQELATAQDTIGQIENLMGNEDYIESITGFRGKIPGVPGTEGFDADVAFNRFTDSLTLENLGKMSGVLSESDIKILSSAAGGLEAGMSKDALISRMETIRDVLQEKSENAMRRLEKLAPDTIQQDADKGDQDEATGIMEMSLEQLQSMNPADMTAQELEQAAKRYEQLGAQ